MGRSPIDRHVEIAAVGDLRVRHPRKRDLWAVCKAVIGRRLDPEDSRFTSQAQELHKAFRRHEAAYLEAAGLRLEAHLEAARLRQDQARLRRLSARLARWRRERSNTEMAALLEQTSAERSRLAEAAAAADPGRAEREAAAERLRARDKIKNSPNKIKNPPD